MILRPRGRRTLRRAARFVLDGLMPPLCPGCGIELSGARWVCGACRRRFRPAPAEPVCFRCRREERPGGDREAGRRCRHRDHAPWRGRAAYWMEPPLDAVVHALKYGGRDDLARPLGRLLAAGIGDPPSGALAVPVPLHPRRLRERGYNQALLLARAAGVRWGAPAAVVVMRTTATPPQARLPESRRRENVRGAFAVPEPAVVRGRFFVLVDDVVTTGSTLVEAAQALYGAGASRVVPVALAMA